MPNQLKISVGQHSDKGRKEINQDFYGALIPLEPQLSEKGIAIALADGISSSRVSGAASEVAVKSFLEDYFCTSEAWSVKKSAQRVLAAANSWLHAQTSQSPYRYDKDRGYVCTLSAMVIKSTTAHIFHVGDARVYRLQGGSLEQLTNDHRVRISREESHLSRALGVNAHVEIDYHALQVDKGDLFLLATDGVYEFVASDRLARMATAHGDDLDAAARNIVAEAYAEGSTDNLTVQIVRVDDMPDRDAHEARRSLTELPFPPELKARLSFDGFRIVREIHASHRSHIYLALDEESDMRVALKTPSTDLRNDPAHLERFFMEDWIARRINSAHVLKAFGGTRKRNFLYTATEFIDGQTLAQWMIDNPKPDLETVRGIVEQIAAGLRAFHRLEMLHQDLRPDNIMIDSTGTVKIVDFGSTRVAGIAESGAGAERGEVLGTAAYTAPEYFLGERATRASDLFSLGVIAYQMLCGKLPYGIQVPKARTRAAQKRLVYKSVLDDRSDLPGWIDEVLSKAVHPEPDRRYAHLSEFTYDLRHPSEAYLNKIRPPLLERNPLAFWKGLSLLLALIIVVLLIKSS